MKHSFGSDNHSGIANEIIESIINANHGFSVAYGEDPITKEVEDMFKSLTGTDVNTYFVFNGTGANVLAISSMTESFNSIICPETAHINVDECGAPEKLTGCKLIPIKSIDGKIFPNQILEKLVGYGFQHHSQPKVVSISQPTELGTLYSLDEIRQISDIIHSKGGYLHIDGARISNAIASLKISLNDFITKTNIDALSFGGTKNGLMIGEALLIFNKDIKANIEYKRKQLSQLFSKNRYIAAQFKAYLTNGLYLELANNANQMAKYLSERLSDICEVKISRKVETNVVFATIPLYLSEELQKKHYFYVWTEEINEVRWMCSFNTKKEDIDLFIDDIKEAIYKLKTDTNGS